MMKYWKIELLVLGLIPFGFTISLLAFYFHAGKLLGHLPSYDNPDPKDIAVYGFYQPIIITSFNIACYAFCAWLASVIVYLVVNRKQIAWLYLLGSATGPVIAFLLLRSDIFEWFLD
jgi:hypothetical protein